MQLHQLWFLWKSYLISIATLCITDVFWGKSSSEPIWFLYNYENHYMWYCVLILQYIKMASQISGLNSTKYFILSKSLMNPFTLSNMIHKGLAPIKVLYKTWYIKIFSYDFSLNKILFKSKPSILIMSTRTIFNTNCF